MKQESTILRPISLAIALAIVIAAVAAVVTLISGDLGNNDFEIAAIALAFALYSTTAAAGMWGLWKEPVPVQWLGLVTLVVATISFGLAIAVAIDDSPGDTLIKWAISGGLTTLALTHLTLTSAAMKRRDGLAQRGLHLASMLLAIAAAVLAVLQITEVISDDDETVLRIFLTIVVLLIATTDIAALWRRGKRG